MTKNNNNYGPDYLNQACMVTRYAEMKPFKRCDYCTMQTKECMGIHTNLLIAALVFLITMSIVLQNTIVTAVLGVIAIIIAISISLKVNTETDKMVNTSHRLRESLEQVNKMHQSLGEAHKDALAASEAKNTFLANISHELRTPLNAIIGYSELLLEDVEENNHQIYEKDLNRIKDSGFHLLEIVNGLLDLAKIESGKMLLSIETFSIHDLMTEIINLIQPDLNNKNNKLVLEYSDNINQLVTDKIRLKQILINVISNACKFTDNGSITITISKNELRYISVSIIDTGIGIKEEQLSHIFEPFHQADDSTTRIYGGTGLGLTISHRLCQILNGSIKVQSEEGRGTCFTIKFPETLNLTDVIENKEISNRAPNQMFEKPVIIQGRLKT